MKRWQRIRQATALYRKLGDLETQLSASFATPLDSRPRLDLMLIRARMAALEHQIALLRLIQSEDRLRQQLWIALPSLLGGAALAFLAQYLKG
jgi:hypothetical protein